MKIISYILLLLWLLIVIYHSNFIQFINFLQWNRVIWQLFLQISIWNLVVSNWNGYTSLAISHFLTLKLVVQNIIIFPLRYQREVKSIVLSKIIVFIYFTLFLRLISLVKNKILVYFMVLELVIVSIWNIFVVAELDLRMPSADWVETLGCFHTLIVILLLVTL